MLVLVLVALVVVTASFLEGGTGPSTPGPREAPMLALGVASPPSGASLRCLFFFLAILERD